MAGWVNLPVHSPRIFACTYIPSLRVPKQKPSLPSFHRVVRKARGASKPRPRRPPATCSGEALPRSRCRSLAAMDGRQPCSPHAGGRSFTHVRPAHTHTAAKGNGWREDDLPRATASAEQPSQPSSTTGMCMYMEVHGKPRDDDLQMMMWCIPTTDIHTDT